MQSKEELEIWYKTEDPWKYKITQDDKTRLENVLHFLSPNTYEKILDIGCGEGFVTTNLPGKEIHGIEISDNAASRLPENIVRVHNPSHKYDLVCTTGTLYPQYNHQQIYEWIQESASKHIFIAGIKDWLIDYDFGKLIKEKKFKYREFTQVFRLYEI